MEKLRGLFWDVIMCGLALLWVGFILAAVLVPLYLAVTYGGWWFLTIFITFPLCTWATTLELPDGDCKPIDVPLPFEERNNGPKDEEWIILEDGTEIKTNGKK